MNAQIDISDVRLETERLVLRPWRLSDLEDFYEYARVDGVGQMAGWMPHKSMEESRKILEGFIVEKKVLALELRETGKVIGSLGIEEMDIDPVGEGRFGRELGYVLSKDYWGRGLMPEAVKAVIDYCFSQLGLDYLVCSHFLRNRQSRRVIEKRGFQYLYEARCGAQERIKLYILNNPVKISAPFSAAAVHLETPQLLIRPLEQEDWQALYPSLTDPEIADMAGFPLVTSQQEAQKRVQGEIRGDETLAIVLKENGRMVGTFSVQKRDWTEYPIDQALRGREFGFDLCRDCWGRGLMKEAVIAVRDYCLDTLGYDFVTCGHFLRNVRSKHLIEKCGFTYVYQQNRLLPTGAREDIVTYICYSKKNPTGVYHYVSAAEN